MAIEIINETLIDDEDSKETVTAFTAKTGPAPMKYGISCLVCGDVIEIHHPSERPFPICKTCLNKLRKVIKDIPDE